MVEIALLYPLIAIGAFSISSAIIRDLDRIGSPIYLNLLRASVGAIVFLIVVLLSGLFQDALSLGWVLITYLVLSVFFNVVVGDTLYFHSQNTLGVKIATPIVNIYPFVTVLLSYLILEESISQDFFLGGILIISGVVILSQDVDEQDNGIDDDVPNKKKLVIIALLSAFGAIICYALGVLFITLGSSGIDTNVANVIRMPAATLILSSGVVLQSKMQKSEANKNHKIKFSNFTRKDKFKIVLAGLLGTYISSFFLVLSTQELGAGRTAILTSTGPLFSLPLAVFWLKEKLGWLTLIGTLLSLSGLLIILG